jgi:hypothetical protein
MTALIYMTVGIHNCGYSKGTMEYISQCLFLWRIQPLKTGIMVPQITGMTDNQAGYCHLNKKLKTFETATYTKPKKSMNQQSRKPSTSMVIA